MIYGLYHSAAGMLTNEYVQNVRANNIANADTIGFKREIATFAERIPSSQAGRRRGPSADDLAALSGGLWLGQTATDYSEGQITRTDSPLDVALKGPGFLIVQVDGQPQFTRDGRIVRDPRGQLVAASDGAPLQNQGGGPIFTNPYGGQPTIDPEGFVLQDGAVVGRVGVANFENYNALRHAGHNRFIAPEGAATAPAPVEFEPGALEHSAVEPVAEMVSMIGAARAYQFNAQMLTLQDQTVGRLLSVVSQR